MSKIIAPSWLAASLLILLSSCQPTSPTDEVVSEVFDVRAYFLAEMERQDITALQKTVQIGDQIEEQRISTVDLEKELLLFKQSSIPKSQASKYLKKVEGEITTYLAQADDLKVRALSVTRSGAAVQRIEIETHVDSQVFEATKSLVYEPARGYTISTSQDVLLAGDQTTAIKAAFVLE